MTKTYDQLDRLVSVTPSGTSPPTASISYDALSRRTLLKFSASEYVAYAYQLNNDVTNILHVLPGGTSDSVNIQYGYDKTHKVTSISVDNSAFLSQPSATSTISYTTDTHHLNQYATVQVGSSPAANYSYDNNGNLTSDGTNSFAYDAENRLITTNSTAIAYDALSRLSSDNSGRAWSWFGDNLVSIGSAPLNLITSDTIDDLIFSVSAGTDANIHSDRLGSPIQSGGYGPFGENGQSGPAGFNGQQYISPGLYFYRSRFYNPSLGRFMQPDSIGYAGGINLYAYVLNDPQSNTDPYGLTSSGGSPAPYAPSVPGDPVGLGPNSPPVSGGDPSPIFPLPVDPPLPPVPSPAPLDPPNPPVPILPDGDWPSFPTAPKPITKPKPKPNRKPMVSKARTTTLKSADPKSKDLEVDPSGLNPLGMPRNLNGKGERGLLDIWGGLLPGKESTNDPFKSDPFLQ